MKRCRARYRTRFLERRPERCDLKRGHRGPHQHVVSRTYTKWSNVSVHTILRRWEK